MISLYDIDITEWTPNLLLSEVNDRGGQVIDATYWNTQWNLHRIQGDHTAESLYETLVKLNATIWDTTDGLAQIAHQDPTANALLGDDATASGHLDWTMENVELLLPLLEDDGAAHISNVSFSEQVSPTDPELAGTTVADILAYLKELLDAANTRIDEISASTIGAFAHNDIGSRDVAEAHPGSAIAIPNRTGDGLTDVTTEIAQLRTDDTTMNTALGTAITAHTTTSADVKHLASELQTTYGGSATTVQGAMNTIYNTFLTISGDVESLVIDHADTVNRDAAGSHPATAVSSAGTLGATVEAALTAAATALSLLTSSKQNTVLSGTTTPSSALGVDGDVYIQYA